MATQRGPKPAVARLQPSKLTLRQLQAQTALSAFAPEATLSAAIAHMGFVQADPIRAPARAQDLILRQRVAGYRAGDLERYYPELELEEGYLYAYGFLTRPLWQLRHPPRSTGLTRAEQRLLAAVLERGEVHPDQLQAEFGKTRSRNAWGGYSTVIKLTLERLHGRGLLRVSRRQKGIRLYAPNPAAAEPPARQQIFDALLQTVAGLLAPVPEASLRAALAPLGRALRCDARAQLAAQWEAGLLAAATLDGVTYLWPTRAAGAPTEPPHPDDVPRVVRLLAPFDPLVWDRRRFEQLWGWAYRFEAYTPVSKRVRGYYALPLLWGSRVIGWANVSRSAVALAGATGGGELEVELGFVTSRPREREFAVQLEAELERMRRFLAAPEP
ncbi:MAG: hypothetical protein RL685_405 [Pseudomonadota bacterium]|jgi:uncharacterized protein YcaQ